MKTLRRALAKVDAYRNPVYAAHGAAKPQKWGIRLAAVVRVAAAAVVVVASRRPKAWILSSVSKGFGRVGGDRRAQRSYMRTFIGNCRCQAAGG